MVHSTGEGSQLPRSRKLTRMSGSSYQPCTQASVFRKGQWRGQDAVCVQETLGIPYEEGHSRPSHSEPLRPRTPARPLTQPRSIVEPGLTPAQGLTREKKAWSGQEWGGWWDTTLRHSAAEA